MRKTLLFTLLLTLFAAGAIGYAAADIYPLRNQVSVREVSEDPYRHYEQYGDVSLTEGLTATLKMDYYQALGWESRIQFGSSMPETETEYTLQFPIQKVTNYHRDKNEICIWTAVDGIQETDEFQELTENLKPGEYREKKIYLKDHIECHKTEVSILFPQETYSWRAGDDSTIDNETEAVLQELFNRAFPIPFDANAHVDAYAQVNEYGPSWGYSVNSTSEALFLDIVEAFTSHTAYFAIDRNGEEYSSLDTGYFPDGYGVYRLNIPEDGSVPELINFYPLGEEVTILKLGADEDRGTVFLYTIESETYVMTVIDAETGRQLQRFQLAASPETVYGNWAVYETENSISVAVRNRNGCSLTLLERCPDGTCSLLWSLEFPEEESRVISYSDASNKEYRYDYSPVTAWNGEYLAFGLSDEMRNGFQIALYDENGLVYYGQYHTSLNIWPVQPDADVPLTLVWE